MLSRLDGVLWLVITLVPLLILKQGLHKEVQAIFLLLTRRPDKAITLFSVAFFPGILLHEGSHYLMAHLLGVRTGKFSLIPKPTQNQQLQLGYVETARTDWLRDSAIGMAPLLAGGVFVAYVGLIKMDFNRLVQAYNSQGLSGFIESLSSLWTQADFWVWFYLALVVSSTMLPSESDRRAWMPLGLILIILLTVSLLVGAGPWMLENLVLLFNQMLYSVSTVFALSAGFHLVMIPILVLIHRVLSRLTGLDVVL